MRQLHEQSLGPYGMEKRPDGAWTIFDRRYEPIGFPGHSAAKRLDAATRARLSWTGSDPGDRVWFYDDGCMPMSSKAFRNAYEARLRLLRRLSWSEGRAVAMPAVRPVQSPVQAGRDASPA